jgi:ABC-type sugar transport system ATPase subunit
MTAVELRDVSKSFAETRAVDRLDLTVAEGEFLILVGPSGCGKTTALRMIAGLEEVTSGEIRIDGRVVNELPPARRDIAMVFQNYALYPNMTVADNIGFPLRRQRVRGAELRGRVAEVARILDIEPLLGRKPSQLSGGQRQRVAIGRALVRRPKAFLMDEPLSNLDAKLRVQMRAELLTLHRRLGITTVYVTHDQTEAMTLGDRVLVLAGGRAQQLDSPQRLYRSPANTFVATFIGSPSMNLLQGCVRGGELAVGPAWLGPVDTPDGDVTVGVRPEDFVVADGGPLDAHVEFVEDLGPETLVHFRASGIDRIVDGEGAAKLLVARLSSGRPPRAGEQRRFWADPRKVTLFDPATGLAIEQPR